MKARRLGLKAGAGDSDPVAVLIASALMTFSDLASKARTELLADSSPQPPVARRGDEPRPCDGAGVRAVM